MSGNVRKITEYALFTALAFIFSYVESLFPLPVPFPGIKLGLANLVILLILYRSGFAPALGISLIRNVLNAFTFGNLFALFYSLAGSLLSLFVMEGLRRIKPLKLSVITVSCAGGVMHNVGQFLIASAIVGPGAVLPYLPFLYFAGLAAGILIGIFGRMLLKRKFFNPGSCQG